MRLSSRRLLFLSESAHICDQLDQLLSACQGWSETKSAYRFFDNRRIGLDEILSGHKAATVKRIAKQAMALLVQDTTFMDLGKEETVGLGTLKRNQSDNYLLHLTVAFTPSLADHSV